MSKIIMVQDIVEKKITLSEAKQMGIMHEGEIFSYFDEGLTRHVFANEDNTKVIKLEQSNIGTFNELEDKIYRNAKDEHKAKMAKTKLVNGFIEQEFVMPIKFGGIKLTMAQVRFATSCRNEVGFNKEGELVCFDLDEYKKY
tara:strand:- start:288 stop:713 length:426 start_codon:yes stop_codon:yes gene_type:complete